MRFHQAKYGIGVMAIGIALALSSAPPATAAQFKAAKHHKLHHTHKTVAHTTKPPKGSDPGATYCTLADDIGTINLKNASALEAALQAGNWPGVKKVLVAEFAAETKVLKEFPGVLGTVPANVRAAEEVSIKAFPTFEKAVEEDATIAQFNATSASLGNTAQQVAADKVTEAYRTATCGSSVPTT